MEGLKERCVGEGEDVYSCGIEDPWTAESARLGG